MVEMLSEVEVAWVETKLVAKRLVEVELVDRKLVAKRFVEVELVEKRLVANRLVEVAEVLVALIVRRLVMVEVPELMRMPSVMVRGVRYAPASVQLDEPSEPTHVPLIA